MLPLLGLKALGNLGQLLVLAGAAVLALAVLSQAGVLVELVVGLVEWLVTSVGGGVADVILDIIEGVVKAVGADAIGV